MASNITKYWLFAAAAVAAVGGGGGGAYAQSETTAGSEDEIVVTATRREARLQDVPIAVTPVTAALIENSGIRDLQDLTSVVPALQFNVSENETSATARLRGIGTQGSNPGLESAVGIFVDGVYRARNGVALTDLGEISQIEVLRGPQGTLFGRNTSAGLISVATAGPNMGAVEADIEGTVGAYNEHRIAGSVSGPIVEDLLAGRVFFAYGSRDGFLDSYNQFGAKSEINDRNVWTVRGQLAWDPTPNVSTRLIVDFSERDEVCCGAKIYDPQRLSGNVFLTSPAFNPGSTTQLGARTAIPFASPTSRAAIIASLGGYGPSNSLGALGRGEIEDRFGFANRTFDQQLEDKGVSGEVTWDVGGMQFTSITAYRDWAFKQGQDSDFSAADLLFRPIASGNGFGFEVFTQEFRLAGERGPVDWLVGLFYSDETLSRRDVFRTGTQYAQFFNALSPNFALLGGNPALGLASTNNAGINDTYTQEGDSLALFTHNIISFGDKTDLTVGLRYTQEEKSLTARYSTVVSALPHYRATLQGAATPAAALLATVGLTPATFATQFGVCNPSVVPTGAIASLAGAVTGLRGGFCVPWLRSDLDAAGTRRSREENEWSGVISLRREFTDAVSGYVSYSRGYKSGGFNLDRDFDLDPSFAGEFVDAYELGLKTSFFDGRLLLNGAVYRNEFENFQLNTFNGIQFVVTSVPEVTSEGFEIDGIWRTPIEGLSYQGGVAYTDAKYGGDNGWVFANRNPITGAATLALLPNAQLTNAPEWTTTHALTYERDLTENLRGLAYIDFRWVDDQNTGSDLRESKIQPSYALVNGRVGLTASERFSVELWARNLLDEEYAQIMFDVPLQDGTMGAFLGDPRTVGVTLRATY